jgi:hypothetical protein
MTIQSWSSRFKNIYKVRLIDCLFTVFRPAQIYGDVTIAGEELQNLDLCSALRAFEQGGIFIVSHLLTASYDTRGDVEDLF